MILNNRINVKLLLYDIAIAPHTGWRSRAILPTHVTKVVFKIKVCYNEERTQKEIGCDVMEKILGKIFI